MKPIDKSARFEKYRSKRTSRRKKRLKNIGKPEKKIIISFLKYIFIFIILLSVYLILSYKTDFWDSKGKLSIVINSSKNDISIVTFDELLLTSTTNIFFMMGKK